jgi:hypothetical protein
MLARSFCTALLASAMLVGCGNIPDVTISYYFPRAKTQLTVTQTIGCNAKPTSGHRIIRSVLSVSAATTNSADLDWIDKDHHLKQGHIPYRSFRGTWSDADATVTLTPDGRLASINATSTGQGDAIIKDLITVAGAVALLGPASHDVTPTPEDDACAQVDTFSTAPVPAGGSKDASLVTLTYTLTITYNVLSGAAPTFEVDTANSPGYESQPGQRTTVRLVPDAASKPVYDALRAVLDTRMDTLLAMVSTKDDVRYLNSISPQQVSAKTDFPIELNKVAIVKLGVAGRTSDLLQPMAVWSSSLPIPMRETYELAAPKPATFGKTAFGLSLSDYGSITSLHYGETNGTPDAADAAGSIAKALQPASAAEKAGEIKGEADLIAQQQRLIACQLDRTTCK